MQVKKTYTKLSSQYKISRQFQKVRGEMVRVTNVKIFLKKGI